MQQIGTVVERIIITMISASYTSMTFQEKMSKLTNTSFEYCSRLEGVQTSAFDLAGIVATCFIGSEKLAFNIKVNTVDW